MLLSDSVGVGAAAGCDLGGLDRTEGPQAARESPATGALLAFRQAFAVTLWILSVTALAYQLRPSD